MDVSDPLDRSADWTPSVCNHPWAAAGCETFHGKQEEEIHAGEEEEFLAPRMERFLPARHLMDWVLIPVECGGLCAGSPDHWKEEEDSGTGIDPGEMMTLATVGSCGTSFPASETAYWVVVGVMNGSCHVPSCGEEGSHTSGHDGGQD